MEEYLFVSPDGGQVSVLSPATCLPHTGIAVLIGPSGFFEFTTGDSGFGRRSIAIDYGIVSYDEEYELGTGHLLIGHAVVSGFEATVYAAAWEGQSFSTFTSLAGHGASRATLVQLFGRLRFDETARGLRIDPTSKEVTFDRNARSAPSVVVPSAVGLLRVRQATTEVDATLPPWPGLKVDGGELFAGSSGHFVIAGSTAVTDVYTEGHEVSEDAIRDFLGAVVVDWSTA